MQRRPYIIAGRLLFLLSLSFLFSQCRKDTTPVNDSVVAKASHPTPGTILVAPYLDADASSGKLWIMDSAGNILQSKKTNAQALNFARWNINGHIRYTYCEHDPATYHIPSVGYLPGTLVVMDKNLNELQRIRLLPANDRTSADIDAVDSHDMILIDDNHYIVETYYQKIVTNIPADLNPVPDCKVVACIIQEVQNGKVIWEWDPTAYPEFYRISMYDNAFNDATTAHDYMHLNSMYIDPRDNNLICSFRHTNQIIKINRSTGAIMWRLGGKNSDFPITADQQFLKQHHVTLTDNNQTLLVYDNGDPVLRPYTRIQEFKLDEAGRTITGYKSLTLPEGVFTDHMGSVQKRGDTYFVCCGNVPKLLEINYITGQISFEMNMAQNSYRAFKY